MKIVFILVAGLCAGAFSLVGTAPALPSARQGQSFVAPAPLGPIPHTCPAGPPLRSVQARFAPVIGSRPVGVAGFIPGPALHVGYSTHEIHGWVQKVLWVIWPRYTHVVTLSGHALYHGAPLWFQIGDAPDSRAPRLDPGHPVVPRADSTQFAEFPSYLFIPAAGCYVLQARWPGGSWSRTFAAGY